jgi:hypothetical protein
MTRRSPDKFITIPNSEFPGLYELQEPKYQVPNPSELTNLNCPCCSARMSPVFDIQQLGFWQDHYKTYFACRPCLKVVVFEYDLSRVEVKRERKSRKAAQRAV